MESVLPMLAVRSDVPSLIEVNGNLCGEASYTAHTALPLSDTGDYYICAIPLQDSVNARRFAVTRKLSFKNGVVCPPEAEDVNLCLWPGDVYELLLFTGVFPMRDLPPFPYSISELRWREGERERQFTLYYEGGLRLALEEKGQILAGYSLGEGEAAELTLLDLGEARMVIVTVTGREKARILAFDFSGEVRLDLMADAVQIADGCPAAITKFPTLRRHERRIRYDYKNGAFFAKPEEIGFFTAEGSVPGSEKEIAIAFCEAVREGFFEEAKGYLATELAAELDFHEVKAFLGEFHACRCPFSDDSGRRLGLIRKEGRLEHAALFRFTFENGKIANIEEE